MAEPRHDGMHARLWIGAGLCLALAACDDDGSSGTGIRNLGISAFEMAGKDELWALRVFESNENADLNGDGDTADAVLQVYDHGTGELVAPGLARGLRAFVGDNLIAFDVPEADQDGTDLNGDGDALDNVLHVYDRRTGVATNTELASGPFVPAIGLGRVAFGVSESAQGNADLDGNGTTNGSVLHVYDSRTLVTTNAGREVNSDILFHDHQFASKTREFTNGDLNGDGDATDENIFQVWDSLIGGVITVPLATLGGPLATRVEDWYLLVSERDQELDLDGDGDMEDGAYQLIEPHLETAEPLGLSATHPFGSVSNEGFAALMVNEVDGVDRNGDGDLLDTYAVLYDPVNDQAFDPALAISLNVACVFLGDRLAVAVDETTQGEDLNGDGDELDRIVHVFDPVLETSTNLGFEAFGLAEAGGELVVTRVELESGNDWNGDGDELDLVFFVWDPVTGELANTTVAAGGILLGAGDSSFLFDAIESDDGQDRNSDGDTDDLVYTLYDLPNRRTIGLGLAAGPAGSGITLEGAALFLVSESGQGQDLNGDGDQVDAILHARE
jgi:hypothetical protein